MHRRRHCEPIFAGDLSDDEVGMLLDRFCSKTQRSGLKRFVTLAKTIRKRKKGILAAVKLGINNARHEGLNRRVLIVVNRGYGFHFASAVLALIMLMLGPINHVLPHERQPAVDPSINPHSCREGRHSLRDAGTSRTEEMTTSAAA
jgi:hypothetical protein